MEMSEVSSVCPQIYGADVSGVLMLHMQQRHCWPWICCFMGSRKNTVVWKTQWSEKHSGLRDVDKRRLIVKQYRSLNSKVWKERSATFSSEISFRKKEKNFFRHFHETGSTHFISTWRYQHFVDENFRFFSQ
jgi:hypothetical protein